MQLTIVALGSYGDVRPFVALGAGLKDAGYKVRIASFQVYADLITDHDLEFALVVGDPQQVLQGQTGQVWMESGKNPVKFITTLRKLYSPENLRKALDDVVTACQGSDVILYTALGAAGYHVAEMMGIPSIYLLLQPISRTREYPSVFMSEWKLGPGFNWISHQIAEQLMWQTLRVQANRWRKQSLNLPPVPFSGPFNHLYQNKEIFIYGYSQHVVPRAKDMPDWHHTTGYWFLDSQEDWTPQSELLEFLSLEPKPIYIGFGSMSGQVARNLAKIAIDAIAKSNQRGILVGGWAEAHEIKLPDNIYSCAFLPHDWLFPQVSAVVHHGGAGTTAAGIRAGVPSIIIPFMGDQPYWGKRVFELGIGPQPVMRKDLTADLLADRIRSAVTDHSIVQSAALLGEKIREENGIEKAVEIIRGYIETHPY